MGTKQGKIILQTVTAMQLWDGEVTGQLSDGNWENSVPHGHYKFWFKLEPTLDPSGAPRIEMNEGQYPPWGQRTKYNIVGLMNLKWDKGDEVRYGSGDRYILRGRMMRSARMAMVLGRVLTYNEKYATDHMPDTLEEFLNGSFKDCSDHARTTYMPSITQEMAEKYYASDDYTKDELKADLAMIRKAMESINR
jgi:hypothetical protein